MSKSTQLKLEKIVITFSESIDNTFSIQSTTLKIDILVKRSPETVSTYKYTLAQYLTH